MKTQPQHEDPAKAFVSAWLTHLNTNDEKSRLWGKYAAINGSPVAIRQLKLAYTKLVIEGDWTEQELAHAVNTLCRSWSFGIPKERTITHWNLAAHR